MFVAVETKLGFEVRDGYGLPCSWLVSKELAERLAASLNKMESINECQHIAKVSEKAR